MGRDYNGFARIGIRRLLLKRNEDMLTELTNFTEKIKGKAYNASGTQLLRALVGTNNETDNDLERVFCSQLVAAALQKMGCLRPDIAASNYLPVDFADNLRGNLIKGN